MYGCRHSSFHRCCCLMLPLPAPLPPNAGRPGGGHRGWHLVCHVSACTLLSCLVQRWLLGVLATVGAPLPVQLLLPLLLHPLQPAHPAPPCPANHPVHPRLLPCTSLAMPMPSLPFWLQHRHPHLHAAERIHRPLPCGLSGRRCNHPAAPASTHTRQQDALLRLQAGRSEAASGAQLRWQTATAGRRAASRHRACKGRCCQAPKFPAMHFLPPVLLLKLISCPIQALVTVDTA